MCPRQSLYKYIYTQTHVYMHKTFFSFIYVSAYTMLSEWVLRQTNLGTTVTLSSLALDKGLAIPKKKKKNILPKHNQFSAPLWMICMSGERYNDHSDGNTLETGHSVQERGILGQNLHIIYISPQKKKKKSFLSYPKEIKFLQFNNF